MSNILNEKLKQNKGFKANIYSKILSKVFEDSFPLRRHTKIEPKSPRTKYIKIIIFCALDSLEKKSLKNR